jgi:hypothetical protein
MKFDETPTQFLLKSWSCHCRVRECSRHCLLCAGGSSTYYSLGDIIIVFAIVLVLEDPMK